MIAEARAAVSADIESGARWGKLGAVFDAHSYFSEAERCYRRALDLEPDEFRWSYHLAVTLDREAGDVDEILQLFRSFESVQPNYPTVHYRLGITLARDGRTQEARTAFERALQLDPALAIAHRQLGQLLMTEENLDAAIVRLERAAELDPGDGAARSALAQAHARSGRAETARAIAEAARGLEPVLAPPDPLRLEIAALGVSALLVFKRGQAALEAGGVEEALELFKIKLEVDPSAGTHYYVGLAHIRAGRLDQAAGHFREAIALGAHPDSHWQLAEILLEKRDLAEGLAQLRKARVTGWDEAELLHGVGVAFRALRRAPRSRRDLRTGGPAGPAERFPPHRLVRRAPGSRAHRRNRRALQRRRVPGRGLGAGPLPPRPRTGELRPYGAGDASLRGSRSPRSPQPRDRAPAGATRTRRELVKKRCGRGRSWSFAGLTACLLAGSVADAGEVDNILPRWEQARIMERQLRWRQRHVVPEVMRRAGVDVWLVARSEYTLYLSLAPANEEGLISERPDWLVFRDRGPGEAVLRTTGEEIAKATFDGASRVAVAAESRKRLTPAIVELVGARFVDSATLRTGFLEKRSPEEMSLFEHVARVAHEIIAEAFSNRVVIPDVTTTDELNWWIRQRYVELGLQTSDHPTIRMQRSRHERPKYPENDEHFRIDIAPRNGYHTVIRRGDILSCDTGIDYLGLGTDTQQVAYVLREGEIEPPEGLRRAIANTVKLQDLFAAQFLEGRSANETVLPALERAAAVGLRASIYSHPIPYYLMRYSLNGRFFDGTRYGAGPPLGDEGQTTPLPEMEYPVYANTAYAMELDTFTAVPEWGEQDVRIVLEQTIAFTGGRVVFLGGRQTEFHVIK